MWILVHIHDECRITANSFCHQAVGEKKPVRLPAFLENGLLLVDQEFNDVSILLNVVFH